MWSRTAGARGRALPTLNGRYPLPRPPTTRFPGGLSDQLLQPLLSLVSLCGHSTMAAARCWRVLPPAAKVKPALGPSGRRGMSRLLTLQVAAVAAVALATALTAATRGRMPSAWEGGGYQVAGAAVPQPALQSRGGAPPVRRAPAAPGRRPEAAPETGASLASAVEFRPPGADAGGVAAMHARHEPRNGRCTFWGASPRKRT